MRGRHREAGVDSGEVLRLFHIAGNAAISRISPQVLPSLKQMENGRI